MDGMFETWVAEAMISEAHPPMSGGDGLFVAYVSSMARVNMMRWSGRSQDLLARAVTDPAFVAAMQARAIPESQLRLWLAQTDVPITFRGPMRGWVEDWAHANAGARP